MEPLEELERCKELLREAYAILNRFNPPNLRAEIAHQENLALLAKLPKPEPLPVIPQPFPPPPENDE